MISWTKNEMISVRSSHWDDLFIIDHLKSMKKNAWNLVFKKEKCEQTKPTHKISTQRLNSVISTPFLKMLKQSFPSSISYEILTGQISSRYNIFLPKDEKRRGTRTHRGSPSGYSGSWNQETTEDVRVRVRVRVTCRV